MKKIILASASKRRSRILFDCGILHKVMPSRVKEDDSKIKNVRLIVENNAIKKAECISKKVKNAIIIGADTLVVHGNSVLGKPNNKKSAKTMLQKFSGEKINVYTGLCVIDSKYNKKASGYDLSSLKVAKLSGEKINRFFDLLAPYDKAGGFSIEGVGSLIFDNIKGSYFNILGLPMIKLSELFKNIGLDILDFVKT